MFVDGDEKEIKKKISNFVKVKYCSFTNTIHNQVFYCIEMKDNDEVVYRSKIVQDYYSQIQLMYHNCMFYSDFTIRNLQLTFRTAAQMCKFYDILKTRKKLFLLIISA